MIQEKNYYFKVIQTLKLILMSICLQQENGKIFQ